MPNNIQLRYTPLFQAHVDSNARMVDYAGWSMPVLYTSILEEARAVRQGTGIFDISHMGRTHVSGPGATALLQKLTTNDIEELSPSEAQYSLLTNLRGGIIDDIIVYRESVDAYLVVINASNTAKDLDWIRQHANSTVAIADRTEATAMIAVQGPQAPAMVAELAGDRSLLSLKRFQYAQGTLGCDTATLCRTGYTGEDGFELIVPAENAMNVWNLLTTAGAAQCGLGARDALRIEAGYPLYGHEIDDETSPVEAGLMWVVRLEKGDFVGADSIRTVKRQGPARKLVGLMSGDRQQPRQGYSIYLEGDVVGSITSGVFSPTRNHSVAMGYVSTPSAKIGNQVEIAIRDKRIKATICAKKSLLDDLPI
jgi:aminomethyltransferase